MGQKMWKKAAIGLGSAPAGLGWAPAEKEAGGSGGFRSKGWKKQARVRNQRVRPGGDTTFYVLFICFQHPKLGAPI